MGKKEKLGIEKVVKKVNKEFEKASSQIEQLVGDAFRQLDTLQNQIHEPIKRLLEEFDRLREREMKRFQDELERRLQEFHELQQAILQKVGLASPEAEKPAKVTTEKPSTAKAAPATKPAAARAKPKASTATTPPKAAGKPKPASEKPAPAKAATKTPAALDESKLVQIKGVGPATEKKLKAAGITSIRQIAFPGAQDIATLATFSNVKGSDTWQAAARKLLGE